MKLSTSVASSLCTSSNITMPRLQISMNVENRTPAPLEPLATIRKAGTTARVLLDSPGMARRARVSMCTLDFGSSKSTAMFPLLFAALTDCSSNPAVCHPNAFCVSDLRMCLCQSGYIGDGISCFGKGVVHSSALAFIATVPLADMNECASDHSPCKPFEKCLNTNGSYACCPAGTSDTACLEGLCILSLNPRSWVREPSSFSGHLVSQCAGGCGKHAECVAGQCVCKIGFTGNPITGCSGMLTASVG